MKAIYLTQEWRHLAAVITMAIVALIGGSCSRSDQPENLEPVIEMLEATGITRTEAVVSAHIENRGTARLSYVRLRYGEDNKFDRTVDADPESTELSVTLEELKPGTSYSCYAEGGTATATLRSEVIHFSTMPNDRPSVTPAEALSTGPVGIIVGFDITDDGGEPVTEAGCEIITAATGDKRRVYLSPAELGEGYHRLAITGLTLNTSYTITTFAANSAGETKGDALDYTTGNSVVLLEPGILAELLGDRVDIECLTVSGEMNSSDFRYLRILLGGPLPHGAEPVESTVTEADLTDVRIIEGGESYDDRRYTVADELSTGLFSDCARLRDIHLPATAITMARDAFARCEALETLTVPAGIESLLPSAGCIALRAIDVSKANPVYTSLDGVLFNSDATEILWFPLGKTGDYTLPTSVTVIGENAFAGTAITGLIIPPSVTTIRRGAFSGSSLASITLPDNITNIAEGMFQGCVSLTEVRLGKNTELIGNFAFDNTSLRDLYVGAELPPYVQADGFVNGSGSVTAGCTLHVPAGCKTIYRYHSRWKEFSRIVDDYD